MEHFIYSSKFQHLKKWNAPEFSIPKINLIQHNPIFSHSTVQYHLNPLKNR